VNGDDTDEVVRVFEIAAQWRQAFATDVVIDVIGYRRHGHNEIDQPLFTQPQMYAHIAKHGTPLAIYKAHLLSSGGLDASEVEGVIAAEQSKIEAAYAASEEYAVPANNWMADNVEWAEAGINEAPKERGGVAAEGYGHGIAPTILANMMDKLITLPEGFKVHRGIERVLKQRSQSFAEGVGIDWSSAEALAVGSLLLEGNRVRLSGQDVQRGTFSHRHAMVHDQTQKRSHVFVDHLEEGQTETFQVCNSPLSEFGVLGAFVHLFWFALFYCLLFYSCVCSSILLFAHLFRL
jgi:2-oxoglutarate dehydrogenase E1 component